jgi:MerR family transcriptional regulator, thiopeptide resistance regulator
MDWSIHEITRLAGTTSRTLRHYDEIDLLKPSRVASNGYRYYDAAALTRLQRILLLRDLGLGLPAIAEVLRGATDDAAALRTHLEWLKHEQHRLERQISSVETTINSLTGGERLMAEDMFDGFDHTQYKQEVEQRWGAKAYAAGDAWWRSMSDAEKADWKARQAALASDWADAATRGVDPTSGEAQHLAQRHVDWLAAIPGTPGPERTGPERTGSGPAGPPPEYLLGLGDMYVADERFAASYGGVSGATFVRDALIEYVARAR